jgi:hypothetical protein
MTAVDLCAPGGLAAFLCGDIGGRTGFLFMGAKTVDHVTEQGAGRVAVGRLGSGRLQLHKSVDRGHAVLEPRFHRVKLFVPHEFDVTYGPRLIDHEKKMLEEFEIFLKFALEGTA